MRSRVLLHRARALLASVESGSRVTLGVAPECLSQMIGQKRGNLAALRGEFSLEEIKVVPAAAETGEIVLLSVEKP